jgi:hypothetical protein
MLIDQKKLDLYVEKNLNVLFEGERGVGKTSIIYKTFEKAGLRVKYFSAPTMDPWTDLVGVPTTITRTDGKEVLRLIPPEDFADDKYDVIFIDELNRAPKKVMNALMELIQFKSINGKPYNIKMIWGAINPHKEDEEYHVEPLDPAVEDRFQIKIKIPYLVDIEFFKKIHGETGAIFCNWWNNQPAPIQKQISPRRLFDSVGFHLDGGDLNDMITAGNTTKLKEDLRSVNQLLSLEKDFKNGFISLSKSTLNQNYSKIIEKYLNSSPEVFEFFFSQLDQEWISREFISNDKSYKYIIDIANSTNEENKNKAQNIIKDVISVNPERNMFARKNIDKLSQFMTEEQKELYSEIVKQKISELYSQNQKESSFISQIGEKDLFYKTAIITGSHLKVYTWSKIANLCSNTLKSIQKGDLDKDRCLHQISERLGALFAYTKAQGKMNDTIQKTMTTLTDSSDKSYIWSKSNIDTLFKDMGDKIKESMKQYEGLNSLEIKEQYEIITSSPTRRKQNKP